MGREEGIVAAVRDAAIRVLAEQPEAPVKVRLLRDVLRVRAENADLAASIRALDDHPHVKRLAGEQRSDGSWGRFHSADSTAKQKIRRTEDGVTLAVELGLPQEHPVLGRVRSYLEGILKGQIPFPDRAEKHENWPTGVSLFTAATLSQFAPASSALDETFDFWLTVLQRAFRKGNYDLEAELRTHRQVLGRSGAPIWMRLHSAYIVRFLGSRGHCLPKKIESAYIRWLWEECPSGLVYFNIPLNISPAGLKGFRLGGWITCMNLIARFPSSREIARAAVDRLLSLRRRDGLWDFGIQPSCPRLSSSYHNRRLCGHDWTTRVVCLLRGFIK